MSTMLVQSESLENVADAIRAKTGSSDTMSLAEMVTNIGSIVSATDEIVDVFVDTNPTFGAMYKSYTAGISGTLSFMYLCRCRQVHTAAPKLNVAGTTINASVSAVQGNQVPAYGTYYFTCAVQAGDSIILDYEPLAGGMNNNHVDLIVAVIQGNSN